MRDIYERLGRLGWQASFVRACILPDWWEDKLASVPANRAFAEALIARHLGVELAGLRDPDAELRWRRGVAPKLKHRAGAGDDEYRVAVALGERLARIAATSTNTPLALAGISASSARQTILASSAPWVGLHELLDFCWRVGIPVLRLCRMPPYNKKPDGMAVWTQNRPVIVVASGKKQPAWHLFIVAHELGHIALGHLSRGEVSIDSQVELETQDGQEEEEDRQEKEANAFAVELLAGDPNLSFSPPPRRITARELASAANSIGAKLRIDPGFIALSYSRSQGFMPVGAGALKALSPDADACGLYRGPYECLRMDDLAEDSRHVFECLTEVA